MIMLDMPPGQEYFLSLFTDRWLTPRVVRSSTSTDIEPRQDRAHPRIAA
jgi:hypothetical protein